MAGNAENWKKAFLVSTPVFMVVLLAAGYQLATREAPKPIVIDKDAEFRRDFAAAQDLYRQAKTSFDKGRRGPVDDLVQAKKTCEQVRERIEDLRQRDPTVITVKPGEEVTTPLDEFEQQNSALLVMCRKALIDRNWSPPAVVTSPR